MKKFSKFATNPKNKVAMKIAKKVLKILGIIVGSLIALILIAFFILSSVKGRNAKQLYAELGEEAPELTLDGVGFRDLNKNGTLDVYEDTSAPIEERVEDLVSQMTVEEKAGTMFVSMVGMTAKGEPFDKPRLSTNPFDLLLSVAVPPASEMLVTKHMNSFNILNAYGPDIMARFNNSIQKLAERSRLGIPVTIATDPRHGAENNPGAAIFTSSFSQWPLSLGLAATRDTILVRQFGDIARQEYRSVGITVALHPMADLATEPRWARANGTFGEDAHLSAVMTKAYVLGFQGDSLSSNSVACMTKHFSGGGPQKDGDDPHFAYGKDQIYPGDNFDYHLIPFIEGAFPASTAQIMPYYGVPVGQTPEDVAYAFNKAMITTLLRDSLGFDGVVCTDWNIISDGFMGEARAWGVEELSPIDRVKKVIDAGCDQFGGESVPELIVELVEEGRISEARLDESVRRILRDKFTLGLFDDPYVDEEKALKVAGKNSFVALGEEAQARSMVMLKNDDLLPLKEGTRVYAEGMTGLENLEKYAELVKDPSDAEVILLRVGTPFSPPKGDSFLEKFFMGGQLHLGEEQLAEIMGLIQQKPAVVIAHLGRPSILTEINEECEALMGEFGTSDDIVADVLFGKRNAEGKLPFELPSSVEAVENQLEDLPYDSKDPLFPFGFGL